MFRQQRRDGSVDCAGDGFFGRLRGNDGHACGSASGEIEKPGSYPVVERERFTVQPVQLDGGASTGQTGRHGEVEQQRQVRCDGMGGQSIEPLQHGEVQSPAVALVGQRGVGKAVTEDHGSSSERRFDDLRNMLAPGGKHEKGFGLWGDRLAGTIKEDGPNLFCQWCAPRFPGFHRQVSLAAQSVGQEFGLINGEGP